MPDQKFIEQLEHQLLELGCPVPRLKKLVQEVADHREDLLRAAAVEGLSAGDAERSADAKLGEPGALAGRLMETLRRSSWLGRHYFFGFLVMPVVAIPVLLGLAFIFNMLAIAALGFGMDMDKLGAATGSPVLVRQMAGSILCADLIEGALIGVLLCWLARRSCVSFKWMLTASAVCALWRFDLTLTIGDHRISLGDLQSSMVLAKQYVLAAIPLLIAGAFHWSQRLAKKKFQEKTGNPDPALQ